MTVVQRRHRHLAEGAAGERTSHSTPLDWDHRRVSGSRSNRWTGVVLYEWLRDVPGLDLSDQHLYGAIVQRIGGGILVKEFGLKDMAQRCRHDRKWVQQHLAHLSEHRLIGKLPAGKGEQTPRWELLMHPCMPGFFDVVDRGQFALAGARRALEVWRVAAPRCGYVDDENEVLAWCYWIIEDGRLHPEGMWHWMRHFAAAGVPPDPAGRSIPIMGDYRAAGYLAGRPDVKMFNAAWRAHIRRHIGWDGYDERSVHLEDALVTEGILAKQTEAEA